MRVLGIEGTAWAASAALYDSEADSFLLETDAYVPESGGIDPRESADHMADAIPAVVGTVLEHARETAASADRRADEPAIDAVAFSQGPGLGPCLRIVATAARALADTLDVPLVGVNHMIAHLEIGRHRSGFADPICLNASGANAHLLAYRNDPGSDASPGSSAERSVPDGGRYRVVGETMDTGVGNALDKVARHAGLSHPGGPKLERAAREGDPIELPYVVKGMDFSFAGIVTAAQDALDDGVPIEDVAAGLQETIFAMLAEVSERALALTGSDELVLGGGVGNNDRLRGMLESMCDDRGAAFFAPDPRFLGDNAAMIALTGAKMAAAGDTMSIADSAVRPDYRPEEVHVSWREPPREEPGAAEPRGIAAPGDALERRGAEAVVEVGEDRVWKRRLPKSYRHPALDERLRGQRTRQEATLTARARRAGVPAPVVLDVDLESATLTTTVMGDRDLQAGLSAAALERVGEHLARLHAAGVIHGDPTTRNVRVREGSGDASAEEPRVALIDFGLGYDSRHVEDRAMDLHVLEQTVHGTAADPAPLVAAFERGYRAQGDPAVFERLREIEGRGRYQ